ncbi:hypothetical protein FUT84_05720 [Treponema phagedenis]|nr:hypothetical protein [Treponema phagedenis]QEK00714.1 hypothetical protein FUT84_05720 [Treponema phagedenis]
MAKTKPASLKASILQNSVDAFKHRFCLEPLPSVVKSAQSQSSKKTIYKAFKFAGQLQEGVRQSVNPC